MKLTDVIPLTGDHNRKSFSCGESSLDSWLLRNARKAAKADTARTYVVCDPAGVVMGYYALCMYSLVPEEVAPLSAGQHAVPAVLLARLAVDQTCQGTGLGEELLLDALVVSVRAADTLGSQLLVVDALHERAAVLRTAAEMEHKSLSAFMLDAAIERARVAVEANRRFVVSASGFSRVLDELDRPAEVVEPLLKLAERVALRKKTAAR